MTAALLIAALGSSAVFAAKATSTWKVYTYNASGQSYSSKLATTSSGIAGFNFVPAPDTALLTTQGKGMTGNLAGKTITATFDITGTSPTFTYYGEPGACATPASVRLYFTGTGEKSPEFYSNYWWSNPASQVLLTGSNLTVTAPLTVGNWSNWNGQADTSVADKFAAAATTVNSVGLSFGGGCFFANGVGVTAGSASFILTSYVITP